MPIRPDNKKMAPKQLLAAARITLYALFAFVVAGPVMAEERFQAQATPAVLQLDTAITAQHDPRQLRERGIATAEFVSETASELEVASAERDEVEKRGRVMVW